LPDPSPHAPFPPGTPVINTARAGEAGVVVKLAGRHNGVDWYSVRYGTALRNEASTSLVAADTMVSLRDLLVGARSSPAALQRAVTSRKVVMGMHDLVYSLGATKTKLFPYQYKPLLKLLQSHARRILVADEVGLGKTIEAGFIVTETLARRPHARIAVVCPAGLRDKWAKELRGRFGLAFDRLDRQAALRRLARGEDTNEESALRGIVSYETIRGEDFHDAIADDAGPDLLVVDEAHRARNPDTATSRAIHRLTAASKWAVYLTATPIQTSDADLFNLLHALNPTEFSSEWGFRERARLNRFVVEAETAIRKPGAGALAEALDRLEAVRAEPGHELLTKSLSYEPAICELKTAIAAQPTATRPEQVRQRVELQSRLFELNLLSPFYTRTRRRHVHTQFAQRRVQSVPQPMTAYERQVHDSVLGAIFQEYRREHGSAIARLVLVSYQMQLASSLAGGVRKIRAGIGARFEAEEDEAELVSQLAGVDPESATGEAPRFARVVDALRDVDVERLEREDSKWAKLQAILDGLAGQATAEGKRPPKATVFSFYHATLDVIERRFRQSGIGYRRIDGSVPHDPDDPDKDERGKRIAQFKDDPDVRVLIASQVGSEGLDLQFANTVVNWDLPWNPMVVEQRIGRVDRLGQESPFVYAFNIVLQGTVEERVLARLYERLDVFQAHIGECEQVLGEVLEQIHKDIFSGKIDPADEAARLEQAEQAMAANRRLSEQLEREFESLVGQEQFLIDKVDQLKRTGRYISPEELEHFVHQRLAELDAGSSLVRTEDETGWILRAGPALRACAASARPIGSSDWRPFINAIQRGDYPITFVAEEQATNGGPALIHAMHPLVRTLVHGMKDDIDGQLLGFEACVATDVVPPGRYLLAVSATSDSAKVVGSSILSAATSLDRYEDVSGDQSDELLNAIVMRGRASEGGGNVPAATITDAFDRVESQLVARVSDHAQRVTSNERSRKARIRTQIDREAEHQSIPIRQRIADIEQRSSGQQILPILRSKLEKIVAARARNIEDMAQDVEPSISGTTFAAGLIEVLPAY